MEEKYLPVGTVVLLQNGTKRVMINGFCAIDPKEPNKIYDYSGVLFPEGSLSSDQALLFDHAQIARVDHVGLQDDEEKEFKTKLTMLVEQMNKKNEGEPAAPQAPVNPENPAA